ncbi:phosphoenolpyruvate mutase [Bacillus songklensis]|uniref:phosphoenolpyruvate mutase n=1 Tax=Bacillus songklensis TaxID=1069116 RepID=A0ABV8B7Q9_9BACI
MRKTTQLRNLINSKQLESIMEAHNALSAKIVEEAGFKGIWASGLSISATMGVRDNNEASWTQVLEVLEFMSDATSIPILLDGDTGYGNFNNARRLVKKLEQRHIAGVCIEDKLFPKTNSFIRGEAQPLADINEFCGKIKAMKDSQVDDDFVVISRVEAFIAGWGLEEALKRAEAYRKAGTDAILIHSKRSDAVEIEAFMKEWGGRLPVVIVPTKYYSVPTDRFRDLGISLIIWANHNLRASIKAMQKISSQIYQDESLLNVEGGVSPLEEVFRLQGAEELAAAEQIYLRSSEQKTNSIILVRQPENQPLIMEQIRQLKTLGLKDIVKTGGPQAREIDGGDPADSGELYSLYTAKDKIRENTIISCSDIIYKTHVLTELMDEESDITIVVDADYELKGPPKYFITAKIPYSKMLYSKTVDLMQISSKPDTPNIHGEFIGLWKVSGKGTNVVKEALEELAENEDFKQLTLADLFNHILPIHPIAVKYIKGSWLNIETFRKIQRDGEEK